MQWFLGGKITQPNFETHVIKKIIKPLARAPHQKKGELHADIGPQSSKHTNKNPHFKFLLCCGKHCALQEGKNQHQ